MREALSYSFLCEVSPTAFSVGAIVFLPRSATVPLFDVLSSVFAPVDREGLILSHGYSRQIEGNTHAEANAIHNLLNYLANLPDDTLANVKKTVGLAPDASHEDVGKSVFSKSWIYTTLEPCSKRTSGLRDCTAEIIHWGLKRVYMVSSTCGPAVPYQSADIAESLKTLRASENRQTMYNAKVFVCLGMQALKSSAYKGWKRNASQLLVGDCSITMIELDHDIFTMHTFYTVHVNETTTTLYGRRWLVCPKAATSPWP